MLAIYGHPFSSYTWKVLIALYAHDTPFEFRLVGPDQPEHNAFVAANSGPLGKFPVLEDDGEVVFESSAIIEYLAYHYPGAEPLLPEPPEAAIGARMLDRVFDNYVMTPMQAIVAEHLHPEAARDHSRIATAREHLGKSYRWLEEWLEWYRILPEITLIECAAAPALYYADWVHPIGEAFPRLRAWLAQLKALPPVRRCIEDARPWRAFFPVPMPAPAD
jgi:glutathione S-transferase